MTAALTVARLQIAGLYFNALGLISYLFYTLFNRRLFLQINIGTLILRFCDFQVPLVVFKREKELARKLEFDGLYVTRQPADDDIRGQWDRLVINTL